MTKLPDQTIEFLKRLSNGDSIDTIAHDMKVGSSTVSQKLMFARHDMQAKNTLHLVAIAIREELI